MNLKGILLKNFRNYSDLSLAFNKNLNIFVGNNGQGKTNILEAIYFLSNGHSFRTNKLDILINKQVYPQISSLKTKLVNEANLENTVQIVIKDSSKSFLLNDKKTKSTLATKLSPIVLFSPESLAAIKDGPDARRQLIDELLAFHRPENQQLFSDFKKVLKSRNKLLKDYRAEKISSREFYDVFGIITGKFIPLATEVSARRIEALNAIEPDFKKSMQFIMDLPKNVDISVDYLISDNTAMGWERADIQAALEQRAKELEKAEISTGISLVGPQKHDISFLFNREDSRYYCSQGQQRGLILAFKMAQIELYNRLHNDYPVLLLDDVMSELDKFKRENLVRFLNQLEAQIFITTTDVDLPEEFNEKDFSLFNVQDGDIVSEN